MKTFLVILTTFICLCASPVFAGNNSDTVISQEALLHMTDAERNAVFEGLKKQAKLQEVAKTAVSPETIKQLADMDVETFKGKAMAVADTLVVFFDKLGVKANEFINTPVGLLTALGVIYKMGVFGGIWSSFVGMLTILIFIVLLYKLNTKEKIILTTKNSKNEVTGSKEVLVPKISAVFSDDGDSYTAYSIVGSIVCIIVILVALCNM